MPPPPNEDPAQIFAPVDWDNWIAGAPRHGIGQGAEEIPIFDPATALPIAHVTSASVADVDEAGDANIDHVTFAGSVETGRTVMRVAAHPLAPLTLELGGKSPLVVLPAVADRIVLEIVRRADGLRLGPGLSDPDMGPIVTAARRVRVIELVDRAREEGARVLVGGGPAQPEGFEEGFFYQPTVMDTPSPDSEIVRQEVFGPVLCIQRAADFDDAIRLADNTTYGLVAGIYPGGP